MIRFTPEQLRELAYKIENTSKFHDGCNSVTVSIKHYPNGDEYVEFEQESSYQECNSTFYRYDENNK